MSHMLSEQMPRLFAYVKKGSTVVRYVHSFRKLYEPGQPEHGSVFGSTGDRDDEGNDPWWVKLATGCFKFKKVKGRFSTDEFHAFYDNTENKGKIWKPEETPQAPQEEKQLPPMVYLPGEFGKAAVTGGLTTDKLSKLADEAVNARAVTEEDVKLIKEWCLAAGQAKWTAPNTRNVNESKLAVDHTAVDDASAEFRKVGSLRLQVTLGKKAGARRTNVQADRQQVGRM